MVRAVVTATDNADGSSSCGYDPASATGMVVARKERSPPTQVMSLHATGLRP